jgi:hypothetical protein
MFPFPGHQATKLAGTGVHTGGVEMGVVESLAIASAAPPPDTRTVLTRGGAALASTFTVTVTAE